MSKKIKDKEGKMNIKIYTDDDFRENFLKSQSWKEYSDKELEARERYLNDIILL